ncbi:MAG: hypothetical protein BWY84_00984 [Candidatus Aerophobetes bacterium ADurb.Bin490]|nr:MAG: hypothetical protein BWY84_00984 [Candidatus Aerophobetes bacterium ADurb.Bin490]
MSGRYSMRVSGPMFILENLTPVTILCMSATEALSIDSAEKPISAIVSMSAATQVTPFT